MAPEKSLATSRPTIPAFKMFSRTCASPAVVGRKSAGTTLPPEMPSSTTSVKRVLGVTSEVTCARSTPGMKNTSSVTVFSASKNSGVNMSPFLATSAIRMRLAPPNCVRCLTKVCMYSCSSGSSLAKPASMAMRDADQAITAVTTRKRAITRRRWPKIACSSLEVRVDIMAGRLL